MTRLRCESEVLTLERNQINLTEGTLRLKPGSTKNDEGRVAYLPEGLKAEIAAHLERVRALEVKTGQVIPWLFPHSHAGARYKVGDRIRDFKEAWGQACVEAGFFRVVERSQINAQGKPETVAVKVPPMLRHDFRRTAVRDMVNAGTPERVAMQITGHKTRAVFDRYHITSPADLQAAAHRMDMVRGTSAGSGATAESNAARGASATVIPAVIPTGATRKSRRATR